jgi:L-amino acid N-acyltransferase YncA
MMIRLATIHDTEEILEIYTPYVQNTNISFETIVPSREEMESRIKGVLINNPWIVLEAENSILGYAYASKHRERAAYRWAVDISIYMRQDCRGKGAGKALYTALISILRLQGYYNVYAGICLPNEASVGIHEYFGFKKIAQYSNVGYKFGQWHDVGWWELSLRQHNPEPNEPISLNSISKEELLKAFNPE